MTFRWKMQLLLLAISLVPMALVAIIYHTNTTGLGVDLAASSQEGSANDAYQLLYRIVDDYGRILERDKLALELAIGMQAGEVERRLADGKTEPKTVFIANESVKDERFQNGLTTDRLFHTLPNGELVPLPVNYAEQVFFIAPGADPISSAEDMARLSDLSRAYRSIHSKISSLVIWQYTGLESGVIANYPGVEEFPRDFDPRKRPWYRNTKMAGTLVWGEPYVDVLSGGVFLTLSQPVFRSDGNFAGVTSIDFPFGSLLDEVKLPQEWANHAQIMSVVRGAGDDGRERLKILAQKSYQAIKQPWQAPVTVESLDSGEPLELAALVKEAEAGRSGVRRMAYNNVDSFWAYGASEPGMAFPVIIIPYNFIVAQAAETKAKVLDMTIKVLRITGAILILVVVSVTVIAIFSSRSVSRPIRELAGAAVDLANGDFEARVDIKSGGELGMLGRIFNAMGPRLKERAQMQASLMLAKKVQQYLLPSEVPVVDGFALEGSCSFCEDLGGDYFDFIDLREFGINKLGVVIGDVSGHGVGAALLMSSVRGGLGALVKGYSSDLNELFRLLNESLLKSSGQEHFMTLFFGLIDLGDRSFRWGSAGHGPIFWMRNSSRQIVELATTGIPLGILEGADYPPAEPIVLDSGDFLILGTDGLWEANNSAGEMYGTARLHKFLETCWEESAKGLHAAVLSSMTEFSYPRVQDDDITLVVVKVE